MIGRVVGDCNNTVVGKAVSGRYLLCVQHVIRPVTQNKTGEIEECSQIGN